MPNSLLYNYNESNMCSVKGKVEVLNASFVNAVQSCLSNRVLLEKIRSTGNWSSSISCVALHPSCHACGVHLAL